MIYKTMLFRKLSFFFFLLCAASFLYADSYSGSGINDALIIRAPVWVFLESQPGVMDNDIQGTRLPPRKALSELSKTIMEGMVYGWKFSYTPFDKRRAVAEEFELEPLQSIHSNDSRLSVTELRPQYPYLYCWAEYRVTDAIALHRTEWVRINYITGKGSGSAERKLEIEGIRQAYRNAALAAVRGYLRKNIKNKPKTVHGEMLIKDNPRLYVSSGKFTAELTVYLYIKEVIPYEIF
ncbi:hypothetical protein E4N65_03130 [Treponema sp. OMZ 855]|nr:hypothetical protein E4N65_03130 [Treponema sp. OMZ 855]